MSDFQSVWNALNVQDKGIRFEFDINSETFRIDKSKGLMCRLIAAERILKASITDPDGIAEGRYDPMIDRLMALVSWRKDDDLFEFDADWREKIISRFPESQQIDLLLNLPYSVSAVILGESRAALVMGQGGSSTSKNSEEIKEAP